MVSVPRGRGWSLLLDVAALGLDPVDASNRLLEPPSEEASMQDRDVITPATTTFRLGTRSGARPS